VIESRIVRGAGHVARIGKRRAVYRFLMRKPEGKRTVGRTKRRWKDNINMAPRKWDGEDGLDSSGSRWGQVAGSCKPGNEPSCSIKCGEFLD
jgi:hypothetical protein